MKVNVTQHSQTGSTHVIIMILLVVALLGALGVVFYQNFIADKMDQTSTSQNDQSTDKTAVKTIRVAFDSKIYAFDYPDAWSAVIESPADGAKKIVLQNPSKSVRVNIAVGGGGLGGACDTNSPYKVRYYTVDSTAVTKLNDSKAYVVAAMVDAEGGGYNYRIGLTEDGGDTHAA